MPAEPVLLEDLIQRLRDDDDLHSRIEAAAYLEALTSRPTPALPEERAKLVERLRKVLDGYQRAYKGIRLDHQISVAADHGKRALALLPEAIEALSTIAPLPDGCQHQYDTIPAEGDEAAITACVLCGHILAPAAPLPDEEAVELDAQFVKWLEECRPDPERHPSDFSQGVIRGFDIVIEQFRHGQYRKYVSALASIPSTEGGLREALEDALREVEYQPGDHPIVPVKYAAFVERIRALAASPPAGLTEDGR